MAVIMYAPREIVVVDLCDGPSPEGTCPRVEFGAEVSCSGYDIFLTWDDPHRPEDQAGRPRYAVAPGTTVCPLVKAQFASRQYFSPFSHAAEPQPPMRLAS